MKALYVASMMGLCISCSSVNNPNPKVTVDATFSEEIGKPVWAALYSAKLSDTEKKRQAERELLTLSYSQNANDRRCAAFVTGEMSSILDPTAVANLLALHLADRDSGVRFIALISFSSCTGYSINHARNALPILKKLCRDPEPDIRVAARYLYRAARHARKEA